MKIDRLLGIITILLQRDKVTAPELAKKLEVSRRTIHRDIDDICKAGIPIVTCQGGAGGISIAEGYKLDKSVLSIEELQNIIIGLKSLGSISSTPQIERLITKLSPKNEGLVSLKDNILIDLASHYKSSLSEKITLLKSAIAQNKLIRFDYYSEKGVSERSVEPYLIVFQWASWYLYGYCRSNNGFRLFKLNRSWNYTVLDEIFAVREISTEELKLDDYFADKQRVTILFDKSVAYRLVEEYGPDCYQETEDGKLRFSMGFTSKDYLVGWILGFGDKAIVIEPVDLVNEIKNNIRNVIENYEHDR